MLLNHSIYIVSMFSENATSADNQQERSITIGWLLGFVDGEGAFTVSILKNHTLKTGWQVFPEFVVTQNEKSKHVLYHFKDFFECGHVYLNRRFDNHKYDLYRYCVRSFSDLTTRIVPFFEEYILRTNKVYDINIFCEVLLLVQQRKHLTSDGLHQIAILASKMNRQVTPLFLKSSHTTRRTH